MFDRAWRNCTGLTSFPALNFPSAGTVLAYAWYGCTGLTSFGSISLWSTASGSLHNVDYAWYGCTGLTSFPTLSTGRVGTASHAWQGCTGLTSFPSSDFSKVQSVGYAWQGCTGLTSFPALNLVGVDVAGGSLSFQYAWDGCTSMTTFGTITVQYGYSHDYTGAWRNCRGLTSFPNLAIGGSNIRLRSTWEGCTGLNGYAFPTLNFGGMYDGADCFKGVNMLKSAYNALLVDIRARNSMTGIVFSGGDSHYDSGPPDGATARNQLITLQGWTITDGGTP
jgi:hypothetical protein